MWPDDPDTQARLIYLVVLALVVGSALLVGSRRGLARSLRDFMVWGLIFAMVVIAYGFRDTLRTELFPAAMVQTAAGIIEVRRSSDGHFQATLEVNGAPVRFIVDTGASDIVLSRADAAAVGIDPDSLNFIGRARTANGTVATAPVRLDTVRFAERLDANLPASVNSGALDTSLLGMAYLDRFSRIEIAGDTLRLHP